MSKTLRIVMGQLNFLVGDIRGNCQRIIQAAIEANTVHNADIIVFPELALTGYPPEDLLLRNDLYPLIDAALTEIRQYSKQIDIIVGFPQKTRYGIYNAAAVFRDGQLLTVYHKQHLPNYGVFDEKRYFVRGGKSCVITKKGVKIGLLICEDIWQEDPFSQVIKHDADVIICINASPFDTTKSKQREIVLRNRCSQYHTPILYLNLVGAQDDLVFDGGSLVMNAEGQISQQTEYFKETLCPVDIPIHTPKQIPFIPHKSCSEEQLVYQALVLGLKDYIKKNGFKGVFIGVSGGIDSALTLAIAVDALGSDQVEAVMLPSRYTAPQSTTDAIALIENLMVLHHTLSIEPAFDSILTTLAGEFAGLPVDKTEENIQARIRGLLLMALANKTGRIVLTTGNKSEMAVGYATLYGDMAGGFAVLKDVPKTLVYRLAAYRNKLSAVIPQSIIDRPPTAELAPGQKDQDTLPPYAILDEIILRYVELNQSPTEIIEAGIDENTAKRIIKMLDNSEYKRRQAPIGVRITPRAFDRERRYPITTRL